MASDKFNSNGLEHRGLPPDEVNLAARTQLVNVDPRNLCVLPRLVKLGLIRPALVMPGPPTSRPDQLEPLVITQRNEILRGFDERNKAVREEWATVSCLQIAFHSEEEVIWWLLSQRERVPFLNAFSRILIALDYADELVERGRLNQRLAGKLKHLINLSEANVVNTRRTVARLAGSSEGSVRKAMAIRDHGIPSVIEAAHAGEVTIHRVFGWLKNDQAGLLYEQRSQAFRNTFRPRTNRSRARRKLHSDSACRLGKYLAAQRSEVVDVSIFHIDLPGKQIFVSNGVCEDARLTDDEVTNEDGEPNQEVA